MLDILLKISWLDNVKLAVYPNIADNQEIATLAISLIEGNN